MEIEVRCLRLFGFFLFLRDINPYFFIFIFFDDF